ncbi:hypothetical protein ACJ73_02313 [Blastomyces percursus]|uniref:Uncharacterized protein n=1 Tax=Blastomyces percursus TaxID=1658174 RepID=A0A1J9RCP9_9EURO|nr:hypothetical protein ACJ73_02313 [Blastomyces percursus]
MSIPFWRFTELALARMSRMREWASNEWLAEAARHGRGAELQRFLNGPGIPLRWCIFGLEVEAASLAVRDPVVLEVAYGSQEWARLGLTGDWIVYLEGDRPGGK